MGSSHLVRKAASRCHAADRGEEFAFGLDCLRAAVRRNDLRSWLLAKDYLLALPGVGIKVIQHVTEDMQSLAESPAPPGSPWQKASPAGFHRSTGDVWPAGGSLGFDNDDIAF